MPEQPKYPSAPRSGSVFLRVVWMAAIPAIVLCILLLAHEEKWTFGGTDLVVVGLVVAGIVARAVDALHFGGTTADGSPATRSHVIGYSLRVFAITIAAWIFAQSVALG